MNSFQGLKLYYEKEWVHKKFQYIKQIVFSEIQFGLFMCYRATFHISFHTTCSFSNKLCFINYSTYLSSGPSQRAKGWGWGHAQEETACFFFRKWRFRVTTTTLLIHNMTEGGLKSIYFPMMIPLASSPMRGCCHAISP